MPTAAGGAILLAVRLELVGLIPAGGRATRLGERQGSKEVLPLHLSGGRAAARLVCQDLLEVFAAGGVERAYVLLRDGKWDVPATLGDGAAFGPRLAYLVGPPTAGVPFTLDRAYPFVAGCEVAIGFPDILLAPRDLLLRLRAHHHAAGTDGSLALLPCDRPQASDLVCLDRHGLVERIEIKPRATDLNLTWALAIASPRLVDFLHGWVAAAPERHPSGREWFASDVLLAATAHGLAIGGLEIPEGRALDIGTPESLARAEREGWPGAQSSE